MVVPAGFKFLDQTAVGEDDPWFSGAAQILRENYRQCHTDRRPQYAYCFQGEVDWGSPYLALRGIFWMWCPDITETLSVSMRTQSITFDDEVNGVFTGPAIHFWLALINPSTGYVTPPEDPPVTKNRTVSIENTDFPDIAIPVGWRTPGWIGVGVWTLSEPADVAEETGSTGLFPFGVFREATIFTNAPVVNRRVLQLTYDPTAKGVNDLNVSYLMHICDHQTISGDEWLFTAPPCILTDADTTIDWAILALGTAQVGGLVIRANSPGDGAGPGEEALMNAQPMSELPYLQFNAAAKRLYQRRVPQWSGQPVNEIEGSNNLPGSWAIFGQGGTAVLDSSTWTPIHSAAVFETLEDDREGLTVILSLIAFWNHSQDSDFREGLRNMGVLLRAVFLDMGGGDPPPTLGTTATLETIRMVINPPTTINASTLGEYSDMENTFDAIRRTGKNDWMYRGAFLAFPEDQTPKDLNRMLHYQFEIPKTDLPTPGENGYHVVIEAQLDGDKDMDLYIVGAAVASIQRNIDT